MALRGGQEDFHRQLPLVQLAAYPKYDGKHDQHRERHSDAGAQEPKHNDFPDCHDKERSARWGVALESRKGRLCIFGASGQRQTVDGSRWIRLDRWMPNQDAAAILGEILSEADALIRLRLKEQGLELPHLVVGATPDNQIVLRSNGDAEVMRSFGEDLKNVADELAAPPEPGATTH